MQLLVGLPIGVVFAVLLIAGLLIATIVTWLASHAVEANVRTRASGSIVTVVGVIAALYAVLVAFVIVNEWQTYGGASSNVSDEAASLSAAYWDAFSVPQPARGDIQHALLAYARRVVCDEIPHLADHDSPNEETRDALAAVYATTAKAEATIGASPFYANLVDRLSDIAAARRARIDSARSSLPDVLFVVVVLTSLVLIAVVSILDTQHPRWHAILVTAVALVVAVNLTLVIALARPFDGAAKVSDAALREGVPRAALVCDAEP